MTKKISDVHIKRFVAILLAVFFGISAFASTRPVTNPDTLTFRKVWPMPGMSAGEVWDYMLPFRRDFFKDWDISGNPKYVYSHEFSRFFLGVDLAGHSGQIFPKVNFIYMDNKLEVIMTDIYVYWGKALCLRLSTIDDRFNRSRRWLRNHDKAVLDAARAKSSDIFEWLTSAIDEYLKSGEPIELVAE